MNLIEFLKDMPVIGILRDIPHGEEEACVKTAASCGLKAIEVTMNTEGAESIIKDLKAAARPYGITVGAGTVRTGGDLDRKITLLLDHAGRPGQEVADPWYTGDFDAAWNDILEGCEGLLAELAAKDIE